jgi:hypothetical protein
MEGINFGCLVGCLGSEPRLVQSQRRLLSGTQVEAAAPGEETASRASTLHRIPWHLPYN